MGVAIGGNIVSVRSSSPRKPLPLLIISYSSAVKDLRRVPS
jgi:hypothetical protein